MLSVLILSHDDAFRMECAEVLKEDGFNSIAVASEDGVTNFMEKQGSVDFVIVNSERPNDETRRVLDYLSQFRPHVSVLLSCDYFSYWNDFFTWLADSCVVTPSDFHGLSKTIKSLVAGRGIIERKPEEGGFAVDWS